MESSSYMKVTFDLPHELKIRKLGQHTFLGAWLYEAIYVIISKTDIHASFSVEELFPIAVEQLREADMISEEMVGPMIAQRNILSALKRMDMQLAALHATGHIDRVREGVYRLTAYGVQEILARTTREARVAFAQEVRRQYDRLHSPR